MLLALGPAAARCAFAAAPAATDEDFALQGEYAGEATVNGQKMNVGIQVIARGNGTFAAVAYPGGLPGAGWLPPDKIKGSGVREGTGADARVKLTGVDWGGIARKGEVRRGEVVAVSEDGSVTGRFPQVERTSPTLGQKPPAGAVVICDGSGPVDENTTFEKGARFTDDGLLMEGATVKQPFGDATWHIEFMLPYQSERSGQGRGNSGAYVNGGYEVQILDSFGLEGKDNECGGIYGNGPPAVNMCLPPLRWQTYDIDFTAPRFTDGKKATNARITVRHNGVVIHDHRELPQMTAGHPAKEEQPTGKLHLQNHNEPVRFRNIWVLPKP
jgi:hypothetical protein